MIILGQEDYLQVCYGGGMNSTAILCGMREREIQPNLITFRAGVTTEVDPMKPTPYELAKIVFETEPSPVSFHQFLLECLESPSICVFSTPAFFIAIEPRKPTNQLSTLYYHVHLAAGSYREAARFCLQNLPWLPHIGWERYNKFRLHRTRHVLKRLLPNESPLSFPGVPSVPDVVSVQVQAEHAPTRSSTYSGV